ncbi:aminoglycoside phosphotransferase family protein [Amycolatopsis suaedae]|uniref:Aminoglycoside phosphotransferase n=1 Tax=Amycolatopsis suaedae TaxID=2510978 RepID=A0A4Q7JDN9_9PSEU|nr:aminoglycoside phosphotransferase family protein [Amycolatopsis suaedae]RZQ66010.1 aminoglycoside phosphotransferase [Amycolatopsis suaedae]
MNLLDDAARQRLVDRFGPGVLDWCDRLPDLVATLLRRWSLTVESAVPGGTGRTLRCRNRTGGLVVLKLTPDPAIAATEAAALHAWAGCDRVVDLLDADVDAGAILLDGLVPGTRWRELGRAAEVLRQLDSAPPPAGGFEPLTERVEFMFDLAGRRAAASPRVPAETADLLDRGRAAAWRLAADPPRVRLVHGDLHPGNLLDAGRGPVAIDPRPSLGDPTFDAVDWVYLAGGPPEAGVEAVTRLVPEYDPDRLLRWSRALAILVALPALRRGERPAGLLESARRA